MMASVGSEFRLSADVSKLDVFGKRDRRDHYMIQVVTISKSGTAV